MDRELNKRLCLSMLSSLTETGLPPKFGALRLSVGFEPLLDKLHSEYLTTLLRPYEGFDGTGTTKFVVADYGGGKTLFTRCVQEKAWEEGFVTSFVELSADECPLDNTAKIYSAVARTIQAKPSSPGEVDKYMGLDHTLERLLDRMFPGVLSGEPDEALMAMAEQWISALRSTPVDSIAFREVCVRHLLAKLKGNDHELRITAACLRGDPVPNSDLATIGVFEKLDKSTGFRWLRSMCQLLQRSNLAEGTVLLFDEARRSLSLMSVRAQKVACENLLSLINYCSRGEYPGTIFLYAVMPHFFTDFSDHYPALQQRTSPNVRIDLTDLGIKEQDLLRKIGNRITEIFIEAHDLPATKNLSAEKNLKVIVDAALKRGMSSGGARRIFTIAWASALKDGILGREDVLAEDQVTKYIHSANQMLVENEVELVEAEGE